MANAALARLSSDFAGLQDRALQRLHEQYDLRPLLEEQTIEVLREQEAGASVAELCRRHVLRLEGQVRRD